jgi:DNA-binding LacI/PurR family transcriptional regulator
VSYVLNDVPHQKIPASTRQRILDAATRLGYAPSAAARALRSGRSEIVLCLLPDWPIGPTVGDLLQCLSASLAPAGLTLLAHPHAGEDRPVSELWKVVNPAAVIAFEPFAEEDRVAMQAAGVDLAVALFERVGGGRLDFGVPQQRVGRVQAEHLAATGHRRLGYAAPDDERVRIFVEPRLDGVRQACADLGLDQPLVVPVPLDPAQAADAVGVWRDAGVTGVCAYNDDVALAVLAGLRERGLRAREDLAVVGVDDVPAARLASPPLTTVTSGQTAVAEHLAHTIVATLAGRPAPPRPGSDIVQLIQRESG